MNSKKFRRMQDLPPVVWTSREREIIAAAIARFEAEQEKAPSADRER